MYLKRLELQGFKSFADRTVLEFMPGITTVIGPNGSGKSNISDAIRWVLGEQSMKSLRGTKSLDIIFAGTQNRKSLGFAEASLVFDNSDGALPIEYTEVTVTRKIYRSGETGYFINKTPCRLKDVLKRKEKLESAINAEIERNNLDLFVLAITDILNSNSQIIALGKKADVVEKAFNIKLEDNTALLEGVVSRKKQLLPNIDKNI